MLPWDTKEHRDAGNIKDCQSSVTEHFGPKDPASKPIPYSDKALETAALEWLIETNQVSACYLLHEFIQIFYCSRFKHLEMLHLKKCLISHSEQTKASDYCCPSSQGHTSSRFKMFKQKMRLLRDHLNVCLFLTCLHRLKSSYVTH